MQVTRDDERMLQDIQRFYNTVIEELPSNVAGPHLVGPCYATVPFEMDSARCCRPGGVP